MNTIRFTLAAGLAAGAALAMALGQPAFAETTVPIDGGGATGFTLGEPSATGSPRSRADVAAEARGAYQQFNSRSGEQTDAESNLHVQLTSTLSRDAVRNEGIAFSRQANPSIYEGGQSGSVVAQRRMPARAAIAHMAQGAD
jgi:hypothetical protein